ncbi:MAG: sialidase family protein [Planctomycetota bacterium]|nr:sialidase family protein [Planctomycetota bacterium]
MRFCSQLACCATLVATINILTSGGTSTWAQETQPVGNTKTDQQRNTELLKGYDYSKYPSGITGYTGQDRQQIVFERRQRAVRVRVGTRGNYKAGIAALADGKLVLATCRNNNDSDPTKKRFLIHVYQSQDGGLHWDKINQTPLFGKEPSLTAMANGTLVLSAQRGYFGPGSKADESINMARSRDGGHTWERYTLPGADYPRNMIARQDGSLYFIRAAKSDWTGRGDGSPDLQLCHSADGKTWKFSVGKVDWDCAAFGEVSAIQLKDGRLLAALRRQIPRTKGEGFEDTVLTQSTDGGKHWSRPVVMVNTAEVHVQLLELADGRILATYSNYHLPYGAYAIVSQDGGKTWDHDQPIRLAASADLYVGWPFTLQLKDESLLTVYALTAYLRQPPETTATEVVRWRLP